MIKQSTQNAAQPGQNGSPEWRAHALCDADAGAWGSADPEAGNANGPPGMLVSPRMMGMRTKQG